MGAEAEIFLVILRRWLLCLLAIILLAGFSGCKQVEAPGEGIVNADQYTAFWLWAGVEPQSALKHAKTVYILEGEVRADGVATLVSLRPATPAIKHADIWMVVRVETLEWNDATFRKILASLGRWNRRNVLSGLQIDFDAETKGLADYAKFLRELRRRLPKEYKLSITGLLDWSANGDPAGLQALAGTVDEIVLQTYQGRSTIPGYQAYFRGLKHLTFPFRIGLVQGGDWSAPDFLAQNPNFKGYVVFLVNPAK